MNQIHRPTSVNRRHFLKGFGVSVALPALSSVPISSSLAAGTLRVAATTGSGVPLRTAFVFFPNGAIPDLWWPQGDQQKFKFGKTLVPLESMRDSVQVLQGLDQVNANRGNDGGGDHARGNSVFLTGVRIKKSTTDIRAGVSIDQAIAKEIGHLTRFPSLELSCFTDRRTGNCDTGYSCAYQSNVSWKTPTNPITPESNHAGIESAKGVRATIRRRRPRQANGQCKTSHDEPAICTRFRDDRREEDAKTIGPARSR